MKKKATPKSSPNNTPAHSTSIPAQRKRLLEALLIGPVTTYEAREQLNIMAPAARVIELREQGHDILTFRETLPDHEGRLHPCSARYVLRKLAREVQQ